MLVNPDAVDLPTSKSDGAARLGTLPTLPASTTANENDDDASSDLSKFSDINSQDDAVTREKKVRFKSQNMIRKGMNSLVTSANTMI